MSNNDKAPDNGADYIGPIFSYADGMYIRGDDKFAVTYIFVGNSRVGAIYVDDEDFLFGSTLDGRGDFDKSVGYCTQNSLKARTMMTIDLIALYYAG